MCPITTEGVHEMTGGRRRAGTGRQQGGPWDALLCYRLGSRTSKQQPLLPGKWPGVGGQRPSCRLNSYVLSGCEVTGTSWAAVNPHWPLESHGNMNRYGPETPHLTKCIRLSGGGTSACRLESPRFSNPAGFLDFFLSVYPTDHKMEPSFWEIFDVCQPGASPFSL